MSQYRGYPSALGHLWLLPRNIGVQHTAPDHQHRIELVLHNEMHCMGILHPENGENIWDSRKTFCRYIPFTREILNQISVGKSYPIADGPFQIGKLAVKSVENIDVVFP